MMVKQNTAVDIISIHHYEDTKNCWFDKGNCTNGFQSPGGDLVQFAAAKAASVGKAVYVGEYGGAGPDFTGPSRADQSFPSAMLEYQIGAGDVFPLSTIWAWSCPSHRKDMVCIWPNSTRSKELGSNRMLSDINNANAKMAVEVSLTASAAIIDETSTQSAMALVNGYFQANTPVANNDWTGGTYMAGNLAHYRVSSNQSLLEYAINWGTQHKWALAGYRGCHGTTGCPDNIIAGQSFYEIYELRKQSYMIAGLLAALDAALQRPCQIATNYSQARDGDACWYWVDALFMALPTYARVGAALSNSSIESAERIWDGARAQYNITVSGVNASGGDAFNLWDAHERLFWRDDSFVGRKSGNGHGIFWSRGNGWAFAAMARTLEVLPLSRASDRAEYSSKLVSMAAKLVTLQGADGCWRSSLEDAAQFPAIETTGTSLFVFGLAWGVNNDVLKPSYRSAAIKGWACLNRPWPTGAVRSDGRLGWCQPGGAAPAGNFNATTTSDFCVGSFLLAGSEIAKLARKQ
jgi:unsaturated rhamnogalacturonyl hydrolase